MKFRDIKDFFKNLFGNDEPENTGCNTGDKVLDEILTESYRYLGILETKHRSDSGKGNERGKIGITKNVRTKAVGKQTKSENQIKIGLNHEERE